MIDDGTPQADSAAAPEPRAVPPAPPAVPPAPPAVPPAGWYPDPGGRHQHRYWNGERWTDGVADNGTVVEDPLPPPDLAVTPVGMRPPETRVELPARAAGFAFAGIGLAVALAALGIALSHALGFGKVAQVLISQSGLWAGLLWACWMASHRYGSGSIRKDYALRAQGLDVGRGFLIALGARLAILFVLLPIILFWRRALGSNLPLRAGHASTALLVVLTVIIVVGAPVVEELFFRGLLLRSLSAWRGAGLAIALQAVVFGSVHMQPAFGLRNVSVFLTITVVGAIQGFVFEHYRRLGVVIFTHAWFNLPGALVILLRH